MYHVIVRPSPVAAAKRTTWLGTVLANRRVQRHCSDPGVVARLMAALLRTKPEASATTTTSLGSGLAGLDSARLMAASAGIKPGAAAFAITKEFDSVYVLRPARRVTFRRRYQGTYVNSDPWYLVEPGAGLPVDLPHLPFPTLFPPASTGTTSRGTYPAVSSLRLAGRTTTPPSFTEIGNA